MDYAEARAYLDSLDFRGMKLGLANTKKLLNRLGNPHNGFKVVHVAGTNGKGSTCALISSALTCAGVRNGLYVSPHIETFRERISINGAMIGHEEAADLIGAVRAAVEDSPALQVTYFEFLTVMAFLHFARRRVEAAVVEVGLGGRYDSTNVVDPAVSVITTIAMDHMSHLGASVDRIAGEKSGIIKPGRPVVVTARDEAAAGKIVAEAAKVGAPARVIGRDFSNRRGGMTQRGELFDHVSDEGAEEGLEVALAGSRQIDNASAALETARILRKAGVAVDEAAAREGLRSVRTAGRFERMMEKPALIMDGAHNPNAAQALCQTLIERFGPGRVDFVFGAMADKDYAAMMGNLAPAAKSFTCYSPDVPRAADPEDLAAAQQDRSIPTTAAKRAEDVLGMVETAAPDGIMCVTGSFYTVGELRRELRNAGMGQLTAPGGVAG